MTTKERQAPMRVNQHQPVEVEAEISLLDTLIDQAQQLYAISMESKETIGRIRALMGLEGASVDPEEPNEFDRNLTSVIRWLVDAITEAENNKYALAELERKLGG